MDKNEFKKTLENVLNQYGFKYYRGEKTHYNFSDGLIAAVGTQKSNYADYYSGLHIREQENETKSRTSTLKTLRIKEPTALLYQLWF